MKYNTLLIENQDGIIVVTLNRPKSLNAINSEMMQELHHLFTIELENNREMKGVILTGAGDKAFVAGADISEFMNFTPENILPFLRRGKNTFSAIEEFSRPVVAAINGYALGGGCELIMACHLRIATRGSKFGQPEVNLGIIPGYGGTQRLVQLIGKSKALELLLTGEMIDAEMAYQLGLLNYIVEPGAEINKAVELINVISAKGPLATQQIIQTVNAHFDKALDGFEEEIKAFSQLTQSDDFKEGASAFLEKRKANFQGH